VTDAHVETAATTVELRLPAKPESVSLARLALAGVAAIARAGPADTADLKLAISEVCTCFVQAVEQDEQRPMVLRYTTDGDAFQFEVEHAAVALEPGQLGEHGNGKSGSGALGLAIARAVTVALRIESGFGGTRIVGAKLLDGDDE